MAPEELEGNRRFDAALAAWLHDPAQLTAEYWANRPKRKETFGAWEKRHRPCLTVRDGRPFYDWTAALKKGKLNGQIPEGLVNGIVGKWRPVREMTPRLVALYHEYRQTFTEKGVGCLDYWRWLREDYSQKFKDVKEANDEWYDAHREEFDAAKAEMEAMPDVPQPDPLMPKYQGYAAMIRKSGLTPRPFDVWRTAYLEAQARRAS